MPSRTQSFASGSSPAKARSSSSAQVATAQAVLERPRVDALFPQMEPEKMLTPSPPRRALSRASRSEPQMPSSFGRAWSSANKSNASELSVATTAFVAPSQLSWLGSVAGSALKSELAAATGSAAKSELAAAEGDALAQAVADAAVAASPSASPEPKRSEKSQFQGSLPYRTDAVSSVVSDWKMHYWNDVGKGVALQRGLRFQDLRYATNITPGVCVLRQADDVPKVAGINSGGAFGPVAEKQFIIDAVSKQLASMGVEITEGKQHGQQTPKRNRVTKLETSASPPQGDVARSTGAGSEANSGASLSSCQLRKNFASYVARDRYQQNVLANPKKGHRFLDPEAEKERQSMGR